MKFAWIDRHKEDFDVNCMCSILQVSRSGFYAWRKRPPGRKSLRKRELVGSIREAFHASHGIYGSPRIAADLADQGCHACVNTVAKYMREAGLASKIKRRFKVSTTDSVHGYPAAPNLLARDFVAEGPNRKWCCDITYVPTAEGFLYVAAVIDCFSRRIVGWSMADHLRTSLCLDALAMAVARRSPAAGLMHHSDRGVQYACDQYRQMLEAQGITASMSRTGDCYDNALMESFWGSMKTEWTQHELYPTREDARRSVFEYLEIFYNRQRRHSAIGYMSPELFEASLN
jgi:transposase InsO family protein